MTRDFNDVWVMPNANDAFIVGDFGTVLRYHGGQWQRIDAGTAYISTASADVDRRRHRGG